MGVVYKLTQRLKDFIIQQKTVDPSLGCRKIATLIEKKFKVKVSKSAINEIIKQLGLSSPVGRKKIKSGKAAADLIDGAGGFFLVAADKELGLSQKLAQTFFPDQPPRKILKIALKLRVLILLPLFNLTIDKLRSYEEKGLWELAGGKVSLAGLLKFVSQLKEKVDTNDIMEQITQLKLKLAKYAHFGLLDGSVFYLDAQCRAIWPTPDIPLNLCITHYITESYIKNTFIEAEQPIILLAPAETIGPEVVNFILACQGAEQKTISRLIIQGPFQELSKFLYVPTEKRFFIFGLFAEQQSRAKARLSPTMKKVNAPLEASEYVVQDGEIVLLQHIVRQEVKLRAVLLKKGPEEKTGILLVTNIPKEERANGEIAQLYLQRWPKPESAFSDLLSRRAFAKDEPLYRKYSNTNRLEDIFSITLSNLNAYAQERYFPVPYYYWDLTQMQKTFYSLKGRLIPKQALLWLKLFAADSATQKDLSYAAERLNESSINNIEKRLVLEIEKM